MGKKVFMVALTLLGLFAFRCFAQNPVAKEVAIGDVLHKISYEKLDREPPLFVAKNIVYAPVKDITHFIISATFSESQVLKSLIVTVTSSSTFLVSGELEWLFPSGEQINMYGKTASKSVGDGLTEYTITFLSSMADLCACAVVSGGDNVRLKLFSKRGEVREFEFPPAFFSFLSEATE
jgi:hypothetical protein